MKNFPAIIGRIALVAALAIALYLGRTTPEIVSVGIVIDTSKEAIPHELIDSFKKYAVEYGHACNVRFEWIGIDADRSPTAESFDSRPVAIVIRVGGIREQGDAAGPADGTAMFTLDPAGGEKAAMKSATELIGYVRSGIV